MINLSIDIICLKSGKELVDAFWRAIGDARRYASRPSCRATNHFFRYFVEDNESIAEIDEDIVNGINQALRHFNQKPKFIEECLNKFYAVKNGHESPAALGYAVSTSSIMRLVLLHMKKQRAILLPHNFVMPWTILAREGLAEEHFLTEVTNYFKGFHRNWQAMCPPISDALSNDQRRTMFAKHALIIFNSCDANAFGEIDIRDILLAWLANRRKVNHSIGGYTASSIQFHAILKTLDYHLHEDQAVLFDQFQEAKKPYEVANRSAAAKLAKAARFGEALNTDGSGPCMPAKKEDRLVSYLKDGELEYVRKEYLYPNNLDLSNDEEVLRHSLTLSRVFKPERLEITIAQLNVPENIKESALFHWKPIQEAHINDMLRRKAGNTVSAQVARIGLLNTYLFFYLPIWRRFSR